MKTLSEVPVFKLMWSMMVSAIDITRLQEIAEKHLPLAAQKDNFSISRDELYWLFNQANLLAIKEAEVQSKQAFIDSLMLEYCPDEMTPEQMDNYRKHQVLVLAGENVYV